MVKLLVDIYTTNHGKGIVCFSDVPALRGIEQGRMEMRSKYLKEVVKDSLSLR